MMDRAVFLYNHFDAAASIPILAPGHDLFGFLQGIEPSGLQDGLILVRVSGCAKAVGCACPDCPKREMLDRLVDEGLLEVLQGLVGQEVTIIHAKGSWGAASREEACETS